MALVTITEASQRLGISVYTIKRRLKRGEIQGEQQTTPQGFVWLVEIPDGTDDTPPAVASGVLDGVPNGISGELRRMEELVEVLQAQLESKDQELAARDRQMDFLKEEIETRRREVQELHVLLQRAQAALPAPKEDRQPWWHRLWQRQRL